MRKVQMPEATQKIYQPGDGTVPGDALGLLNQLLAATRAPTKTVCVWFGPRDGQLAEVTLVDQHGNLVEDDGDISLVRGEPDPEPLARFIARRT